MGKASLLLLPFFVGGGRSGHVVINHGRRGPLLTCRHFFRYVSSSSSDGGGDSSSADDKKIKPETPSQANKPPRKRMSQVKPPTLRGDPEKAKAKLNDLLQSILKDQEVRKQVAKDKEASPEPSGEDTKNKIQIDFKLARPEAKKPTAEEQLAAEEEVTTAKTIGKDMLKAVKKVAKTVKGNVAQVESELVTKLKSHAPSKLSLSQLFEGMTIDKEKPDRTDRQPKEDDLSRARRVRQDLGEFSKRDRPSRVGRETRVQHQDKPIDIFGAKPLGIFTKESIASLKAPISYLKTWDALEAKDLKLAVTHPPTNGFDEMILWTEQKKLWRFPIDNEQDLDVEAKVSFTEHIFLEKNIDYWCPTKGPMRHFMELVCIGLAKNPYLTVQEKKDHLEWYHEYFKGKADIIKEVGAGEIK